MQRPKLPHHFILPLSILVLLHPTAQAREFAFYDENTRRAAKLELKNSSVDDALIEWATVTDFNLLVDSTQFSTDEPKVSGPKQGSVGQLLLDIVKGRKISGRRYDAQTFLLWKINFDWRETARLIIAREQQHTAAELPPLKPEQMNALLFDYFKGVHGWDGKTSQIDIKVKIAALPPELRERVLHELRAQLLSNQRQSYPWFSDDLWQKARLHLQPGRRADAPPQLFVGAALEEELGRQKRVFYRLRSCASPSLMSGGTWESRAVYHALPRPEIVRPNLDFRAQKDGQKADTPLTRNRFVSPQDLKADARLGAPISLRSKRLSVQELLAELQKQSRVSLVAAPDAPANVRITLRTGKMPLSSVMGALSDVLGAGWEKKQDAYTLYWSRGRELDVQMLRVVEPEAFPMYADAEGVRSATQFVRNWMAGLLDDVEPAASSDAGQPILDLPLDTQQKLRERFETMLAATLVHQHQTAQGLLAQDLELHFRAGVERPRRNPRTGQLLKEPINELSKLRLGVLLPPDSPLIQSLPQAAPPDAEKQKLRERFLGFLFPTFPSGETYNSYPLANKWRDVR